METTALALGVSVQAVRKRTKSGRIPFAEIGDRGWFRRADVEVLAAARTFVQGQRQTGKVLL